MTRTNVCGLTPPASGLTPLTAGRDGCLPSRVDLHNRRGRLLARPVRVGFSLPDEQGPSPFDPARRTFPIQQRRNREVDPQCCARHPVGAALHRLDGLFEQAAKVRTKRRCSDDAQRRRTQRGTARRCRGAAEAENERVIDELNGTANRRGSGKGNR